MTSNNITIQLSCGDYTFKQIDNFGIANNSTEESSNTQACKANTYKLDLSFNSKCNQQLGSKLVSAANTACFGKNKVCSFSYDTSDLTKNCSSYTSNINYFYLTYRCECN